MLEDGMKKLMIDVFQGEVVEFSLWIDDNGTPVEVTGGDPAYARVVPDWVAATDENPQLAISNEPAFNVPENTHPKYFGGHNAGGTRRFLMDIDPGNYAAQGTLKVASFLKDLDLVCGE